MLNIWYENPFLRATCIFPHLCKRIEPVTYGVSNTKEIPPELLKDKNVTETTGFILKKSAQQVNYI